jgi:indolepyruvate ferredoxin oxidoreductase beta subunit
MVEERDRISVAVLALGGQGGGVLADWILDVAAHNGFVAQGTSVPGVAQRTGATIYYIELARSAASRGNATPVLAVMPVPGDVDVVIASELMEAGRAMVRGLVSEDRTTLITSTNRVFAIAEKAARGDGRVSSDRVLEAAERRAKRFIGFDMEAAAVRSGSVISSVMLGALAASDALPFTRTMFEDAIRRSGKAIAPNLKGFATGFDGAASPVPEFAKTPAVPAPEPTTSAGRALKARILDRLPRGAHTAALHGAARMLDYQDKAYADLYLDRLEHASRLDTGPGAFTTALARHLALWMAYEDTVRVADLKVRASRRQRVEEEVRFKPDQVLVVTEYMHPRLREACDTMPARLGRWILGTPWIARPLERLLDKGRHVRTTSLRWNLILGVIAGLRPFRRATLRYGEEQTRIGAWLDLVEQLARQDLAAASELVESQSLIKGYGDTFERGIAQFETVMNAARGLIGAPLAADRIRTLRSAALADDTGTALKAAMNAGCAPA